VSGIIVKYQVIKTFTQSFEEFVNGSFRHHSIWGLDVKN